MRRILFFGLLTFLLTFAYNHITFAVCGEGPPDTFTCNTAPPNPDPNGIQEVGNPANLTVNVPAGTGIDTRLANGGNGGPAMNTGIGNDDVDVDNGNVAGEMAGIEVSSGNDEININESNISGDDGQGIGSGPGDDEIIVTNSTVTSQGGIAINSAPDNDIITVTGSTISTNDPVSSAIGAAPGDDIITVTDSTVIGGQTGIQGSPGNDQITVIKSFVSGDVSINGSTDDDIIELGTAVDLDGIIDCGPNVDTLIFSMEVPEDAVSLISSEILSKNPGGDSIVINNLFYEWENCEILRAELQGVSNVRPIPTISEWGLIAMAALLGLAGLFFVAWRSFLSDPV